MFLYEVFTKYLFILIIMNSNIDYYKYINRIKFNITNCNKITDTDIEYGTKFRYMCFKFFVKSYLKVHHVIVIIVIIVLVFVIWHNREKWKSIYKVDGGGPIGLNTTYTAYAVKEDSPLNRTGTNDINANYYYKYSTYIFIVDNWLYIKVGGSGNCTNAHYLYKEIKLHKRLYDQILNQIYDITELLSRDNNSYSLVYLVDKTTIFNHEPQNKMIIFNEDSNGHACILKFIDLNNYYTCYFILMVNINRSYDLCLQLNNLKQNVTNTISQTANILTF